MQPQATNGSEHSIKREADMEMTLLKFLMERGLLKSSDNRIAEMKKLGADDREWFKQRAKIEFDIDIAAAKA